MYGKGDYEKLRKMMSGTDWEEQLDGKTVEQAWTTVRSQIDAAVASCIPKKTTRPGDARSRKPWNTSVTIGKVKMKNNMYRRWRNSRDNEDYLSYARARNQARSACRKAVRLYEKDIASQIKQNPKQFWRYVKSKLKVRQGVPNLEREDGTLTETDFAKAEVLNSFFKKVFTLEDDSELPNVEQMRVIHPSQEVTFTEDDIEGLLSKLNIAKSAGADGLHPRILKELSVQLAQPLFILFRMSLETGMLPDDWKIAHISPIFKKGHRYKPGNYRPVSLTAVICKIMEKLVRRNIIDHLEQNELIDPAQHGFVKGRSCVTNLLETFEQWTQILDDGGSIDVIYMDFMKAFDKVPHMRLLVKLQSYGICSKTLDWIKAFLAGRHQRVVVNGQRSEWSEVTSGIPQGSVLGPLLFVMFINDLPKTVQCGIKLFADGTKVYVRSDIPGNPDCLQNDITRLQDWSDKWLLSFHPDKCKVMHIGNHPPATNYTMRQSDNTTLDIRDEMTEKDMGVAIDNHLNFKLHISQTVSQANRLLGMIRRSFEYLDQETFLYLYKGLIRPNLEYAQAVWNPHLQGNIYAIEAVQRRTTKLIPGFSNLEYPERLKKLNLTTLVCRRARGDMLETFKYLNGQYNSAPILHLDSRTRGTTTRGHQLKLEKGRSRLDVRKHFFTQRVVNLWNALPVNLVSAPTVNAFKNRLDTLWKDAPFTTDPNAPNIYYTLY